MTLAGILRTALLFGAVGAQFTVDPPTTAPANTVQDCTNWIVATGSETCEAVASDYALTVQQLYSYNPSLASGCSFVADTSYCVEENWGIPPPQTSTTSSATTATPTGNGITTPTPTQSGMAGDCNKFHFVKSGQSCSDVLALYDLTLATFYSWNKGVGAQCNSMWAEVYVCVGVKGGVPNSSATAPPTMTTGNGIATPTPTQPGMVANCNKFHHVTEGQSCSDVLAQYSLPLATFYSWNTGVGPQCTSMWANVYVCVGVVGGGPTMTTTTSSTTKTTPTNGITTPTPTQPGMISDCDKFDFVQQGESCNTILSRNGLTVSQLYAWNSGVGPQCNNLWAEVYVCVHKIGAPTGTTMTTKTSTTSTGNGIATPTPSMPGMVGNCRKFYKVVDGDTCDKISSKTGASKANIIKWNTQVGSSCNVWLGYFICVGLI